MSAQIKIMSHGIDSAIKISIQKLSVAKIRKLYGVWSQAMLSALFHTDFVVASNLNTLNLQPFGFKYINCARR